MEFFLAALFGIVFGILILLALGWVLHWLWNTTLPDIMDVKPITVVQAIKLMFIASILFGGHRVVTVEQPAATVEVEAASDG